jgi:hypothetical protein
MSYTYYLVTLCSDGHSRSWNTLVVGLHPTEWFVLDEGPQAGHVLLNFWEITEAVFGSFPHEMQNAAWDDYHAYSPDEDIIHDPDAD